MESMKVKMASWMSEMAWDEETTWKQKPSMPYVCLTPQLTEYPYI
jgi:hypothetical protein